jgi:alkylglycerol monooxygenase
LLLIGMHFLGAAPALALVPAALYALYLVYSLWTIGFLLEGRRAGLWLELLRNAGTALGVGMTGRWFGVAQLDSHMALALVVLFGVGAAVVLGLAGYQWRHADTVRPALS